MPDSNQTQTADRFLQLIRDSRRGKLKIYLGMSAGVGKTYRMLRDAHDLLEDKVDVVIGFIETHSRSETLAQVAGIPAIATKKIFYKGHSFEEPDVEAIIRRRPEVVLIDELAHTNVTGSKNTKRYQDVEDIRDAGINVITALNIQHIESLNPFVEKFTKIAVQETVPDFVIQTADEVVNIDLTVDELLERLDEGKIYNAAKVAQAKTNFFQRDNLLQLRELALREVANVLENKIDTQLLAPQRSHQVILSCISSNHKVAKGVLRKSSRIVERLRATWIVLYVQTPSESDDRINLALQRHLIENFKFASTLGAEVIKVEATEVAQKIAQIARDRRVNRIMLGRSGRNSFQKLLQRDVILQLLEATKDLEADIMIVAQN